MSELPHGPQPEPLLARLIALEQDIRYQEPAANGEALFGYTPGTAPVLLSAPHGAVHRRNGRAKDEDEFTAGMARLLAERSGAHVLYLRRRSDGDANADGGAGYKDALLQIVAQAHIGFVLDLHGSNQGRDFGLALGTIRGQSCLPAMRAQILATLAQHGFSEQAADRYLRVDVDRTFPGAGGPGRETVIRFLQARGIPAMQIEINALLRIARRKLDASAPDKRYHGDPVRIRGAIAALEDVVRLVLQCS